MKTTKNLGLNMPDANDFVEIDKINKNTEKIDEELAKKADASGGDISETVITSTETSQAEYPVPAAGDSAKTVLGKVQKFFADIRNWMTGVCLLGQIVNNCVTDNAKLPLSAAQGKVLMDLYNVLNTNQQEIFKKYWSLSGRYTNIAADTDMHTIIQSGNYGCGNNDIANSLKNCPMDKAFVLHVYSSTGSGTDYYIIQEYTAYDASRRILNFYNTDSKTWIAREFAFKS